MKKYLLAALVLSACSAKPYACYDVPDRSGRDTDIYCWHNSDIEKVAAQESKRQYILELTGFSRGANLCPWEQNPLAGNYYAYSGTKNKIYYSKIINVCPVGTVDKFEESKASEEQELAEEQRIEREGKAACKKLLKDHPNVRKQLRGAVKDAYKQAVNSGAVEMKKQFVESVSECIACVYDKTIGERTACQVIESGGDLSEFKGGATATMYQFSERCEAFYLKEHTFDPCKWAKDMNK